VKSTATAFLAGAAIAALLIVTLAAAPHATTAAPLAPPPVPQDPSADGDKAPDMAALMAEMMANAQRFTQPGEQHQVLRRFVGTWKSATHLVQGDQRGPGEPGTVTCDWLMDGRWLRTEMNGSMMGMPLRTFSLMGYDNFKHSFVTCDVNSMDTALRTSEGDLTQDGRRLITYGTLDEYLTGEHDKMVRYVWRFESDDRIVMEVHDLAIGDSGTQVVEVVMERR
jgi:hypothetical protein